MAAYSKILTPVDFSDYSREALLQAGELARQFGSELHLLHVLEPWPPAASVTSDAYPMFHEYVLEANTRAATALADLAVPAGVIKPVKRVTRSGHVEREILKYAEEEAVDLIVLGTHGRTGLSHLVMGSVAEKVIRLAHCPVLVVRAPRGK
jgi:universal stress protein A